ncbi:hypothetical protein EX895_002552 [Sporisorium graminicola]|uniref:Uncharacterized protein n=1 Tax=Sporisorium graminicola TaxID=280036 RepID=A0A4U7KVG5_9BASI|nr:hypothetical protein EX895_002552 [Sporisorium graminicola]TKY88563.1 hypothetical protein EX895_002552 [Sporisorium graminicola]
MIDELIHSCIEQIGLDGEAGTDIDRFADFIRQYHTEHSSRSQYPDQLVDASYLAFVFRQLLGHPHVHIGLVVQGVPLQSGAKSGILKRKSSSLDSPAGKIQSETSTTASPEFDSVELLPDQALAEQQGLAELQRIHGQRLRLVLQTPVIKRLLVGSESIYLPPSAFRVLQIISRSRETPVLSIDIGTAMHTDQKTVFYMCKRLIDHHLVTKIKARETGTVASYFVATRFEDRCDILIQQRNADNAADRQHSSLASLATVQSSSSSLDAVKSTDDNDEIEAGFDAELDQDDDDDDDDGDAQAQGAPTVTVKEEEVQRVPEAGKRTYVSTLSSAPTFERVDAAKALVWMNSRPELVRFRIYLICNSTSSKVTARLGLLHRINLALARDKKKALLLVLERAVVDGFLEVVNIQVSSTGRSHRGLRMTSKGLEEMHEMMRGDYGDATMLQEQVKAANLNAKLQQDLSRTEPALPREVTLERHVHELIARAGPAGRTISQLMAKLHATGHFARALDQIAQRADDANGEPSMSDLQVRSFHEHKLRVRSTKMYSYHAWVLQSANEGLLDPDDVQLLASAGGSSSYHRKSAVWTAPDQVSQHLASLGKDVYTPTPGKGARRTGRPPKKRSLDADSDAPPPKRGRPRIHPLPDPDTPPAKRGRPRKNPVDSVDAGPVDTPAAQSPVPLTPRVRTLRSREARQAESPALDSSPRSETNVDADVSMDEDATTVVPDSPAAGAASRRSNRRVISRGGQTRTASLLSTPAFTAAAEEPVASQVEQEAVAEPSVAVSTITQQQEEQTVSQEAAQSAHTQGTGTETVKETAQGLPLVDVSRVGDLMSAPTEIKAEARSVLPTTPAPKKPSDSTAMPSTSHRKSRTNLTQLRSSHALVQCIRDAGGAMDALQIPDLLTDYVEKHGFASDAQLSDLRDRKVREKALVAAVDNNMLRRTFIRLDLPIAHHPRRQILYLPDLPAEKLQAYCEAVKQGRLGWFGTKSAKTALRHVTDSVAIASVETLRFAKPWHVQDALRLADLPTDQAQLSVLRQSFRDVFSVYRQYFGFLSGEMLRLKAFHLACAKFITLRRQVSSEDDHGESLPLSFFWTDAPLDLVLGFVPVAPVAESIETMLLDPQLRSTPVRALPEELKASLGLSDRVADEVCVSIYSLATQLADLGVVHLRATDAPADKSGSSLNMSNAMVEPLRRLPLYDWQSDQQHKPLVDSIEAGLDVDRINHFWARVQAICLATRRKPTAEGIQKLDDAAVGNVFHAGSGALADMPPHKAVAEELSVVMHTHKTWRPYHQLRPSQVKFLFRIDLQDIPLATQADIDRLAYVTLAPPHVVRTVLQTRLQRANESVLPDAPNTRRPKPRFTWPLMLSTITLPTRVYEPARDNTTPAAARPGRKAAARVVPTAGRQIRIKTQAEREREGRRTTLTKARQLRQRRELDFQAMLEDAFQNAPAALHLRAKIETALSVIRRKFVAGDVVFDTNAVQAAIQRAIRSTSGLSSMPAIRAPSGGRRKRRQMPTPAEQARDSEEDEDQSQQADGDADAGSGRPKRDRRARKLDQVNFWTPARKELLRDAAVILRVRDQVRGRSDWSALFQVIDRQEFNATRGVIMAQWRGQYYRMRAHHGEESYLAALESRWIPVYLSARESGILQDDDFPAASGFDLVAQIELLRARIDKNEVQRSLSKPVARHHLPLHLGASTAFTTNWKEEFVQEPVERRFESFFAGELGVASKRFETLLFTAFGDEEAAWGDAVDAVDAKVEDLMAEWAVRIVIASAEPDTGAHELGGTQVDTPPADEAIKAEFCKGVGDARIEEATQRLLDAKLIRSITVDPGVRRKPGTNFVFTEELQKLLPDPSTANRLAAADLQAILAHRREAFEQIRDVEAGVTVEPVEADGEAAALLPLMQAGLISAEADEGAFEALRQNAAFNARVLNDDDLEAMITVKGQGGMMDLLDAGVVPLPDVPVDQVLEWLTIAGSGSGAKADSLDALLPMWQQRYNELVKQVSATDSDAGRRMQDFGSRLMLSGSQGTVVDAGLTHGDVLALTHGPLPLAFFSPLSARPVLVASAFVRAYTLSIPPSGRLTLPHIWTSLTAPSSVSVWRALLDTVVALTLSRPGVSVRWMASRFSANGEAGERVPAVGTSFADVWAAVGCLVQSGVLLLRVGEAAGLQACTLHPGSRSVWAGFRS